MKLTPIIAALRERCALFQNRVAGAAQFQLLAEKAALAVPCAYVLPLDDAPGDSLSKTSVTQDIKDSFAVVVVLSNLADERGQSSSYEIHDVRAMLFSALLNWSPSDEYDGIIYEGFNLLSLDRSRLWVQFEFGASTRVDATDGWQEPLPDLVGININIDVIEPIADPNLHYPGPDGRIEFVVKHEFP